MSLVTRIFEAIRPPSTDVAKTYSTTNPPPSWLNFAYGITGSSTGTPATPYSALQTAAYACCRVLAEDVARLPIRVRRRLRNGGAEEVRSHPVARLLRYPNDYQTMFDFVSHIVWSLSLRGNAYVYIGRKSDGTPAELIPLLPDAVTILVSPSTGDLSYQGNSPRFGGLSRTIRAEDMIHVKNVSLDGVTGLSPITVGQQCISLASAMSDHAGSVFRSGTMLRGFLSTPGKLGAEAAQNLGAQWNQTYGGSGNAHRVAVMEDGLTFQPMSMSPVDAQLLEQRKASVEEIARNFRVPLHKIGAASVDTKGNTEVLESGYVNDSLVPIIERIEQAFEMRLLFDDERDDYQIEFDLDSMLRSDMSTRFSAYQTGLLNGFLCTNEVRSMENLPPVDHGDTFRIPMNQQALTSDSVDGAAMTNPTTKPDNNLLSNDNPDDAGEDA